MATERTYRAITEVHITTAPGKPGDKAKGIAPTPPTVTVIPAKGLMSIDPDNDTCKELIRNRAIELDTSEREKPVQKVSTKKSTGKKPAAKKPAAKPVAKPADKDDKGTGTGGDGSDMV